MENFERVKQIYQFTNSSNSESVLCLVITPFTKQIVSKEGRFPKWQKSLKQLIFVGLGGRERAKDETEQTTTREDKANQLNMDIGKIIIFWRPFCDDDLQQSSLGHRAVIFFSSSLVLRQLWNNQVIWWKWSEEKMCQLPRFIRKVLLVRLNSFCFHNADIFTSLVSEDSKVRSMVAPTAPDLLIMKRSGGWIYGSMDLRRKIWTQAGKCTRRAN